MAGSINLTALTTNLGTYCRENKDEIFSDMLLGMEDMLSRQGIELYDDVKDEYPLPNLMVGDLLQPSDYVNFAPKNNALNFDSRTLKVRPFKADLLIFPQEFEKTWLAHARRGKGTFTKENMPFYQFLMTKIIEKIKRELRYATWKGVYNAAGTAYLDICDGYLAKIAADITAGGIVPVVTGAVTAANVIASIEATAAGLGVDYKDQPGKCIVSPTLFGWYVKSTETAVGRHMGFNELSGGTNEPGQNRVFLRGTNIELISEPAFGASQRIVVSTDNNLVAGTDSLSEINDIKVQEFNRSIKLLLDGKWGVDYKLANATYKPISTNDQA